MIHRSIAAVAVWFRDTTPATHRAQLQRLYRRLARIVCAVTSIAAAIKLPYMVVGQIAPHIDQTGPEWLNVTADGGCVAAGFVAAFGLVFATKRYEKLCMALAR